MNLHVASRAWRGIAWLRTVLVVAALHPPTRVAAQEERDLLGTWLRIRTDPSGVGLYTQLTLRPDGTYDFLSVLKTRYTCVGARNQPGGEFVGEAISYTGRYRVTGGSLVVTPIAGKRGCTNRMTPLAPSQLLSQPGLGNRPSHVRLVDGQLCLRLDDGGTEGTESCLPRATTRDDRGAGV